MKIIKLLYPYFLCATIIFLGVLATTYTSEKLTERYTYSLEFEEKESQAGVYYIDNSENFVPYPWNIYQNEELVTFETMADVYINENSHIFVPIGTEYYQYLEIPFKNWECNEESGLLFYNNFVYLYENSEYYFDICLEYSDYILLQFVNGYNYYAYESEILSFMKEKINKEKRDISNDEISDIILELEELLQITSIEENTNSDEKTIFYDEYIYNKLLVTNINSQQNYEIYSYNDEIYIVFTESKVKTTFVYDACDKEFLGFNIQK
ncbi:MAG: hypothetical protein R3Y33_01025 [Clostridia bacterium]